MTTTTPTAIVTGASSGIGEATAQRLASDGMAVVLVGRDRDRLERVTSTLRANGASALPVSVDLGNPDAAAAIVKATIAAFGRIDAVVNNAAVAEPGRLDDVTVEHFDNTVAVNVRAPLLLIREALPALRASPRASVVNITSAQASASRPGQCVYALSKAALEHLTRSLASELGPDGIRVNAISPGPVDTPVHQIWARDRAEVEAAMFPQLAIARLGDPAEVATWVSHLCDPQASWVTGAVIAVDGGHGLNLR